MNLIELFFNLFLFFTWLGYLGTIIYSIKAKHYPKTLLIIFVPFYVFYYLLKLPKKVQEVNVKILTILTIGCFWIVLFMGILQIVFTPPQ